MSVNATPVGSSAVEQTTARRDGTKLGALDRAADRARTRGVAGVVVRTLERVLDAGIDGRGPLESAQQVADRALQASSTPDAAIDHIVRAHLGIGRQR